MCARKRELYAKANMICATFGYCSSPVKVKLFKSLLSNIYCNSLWLNNIKKSHELYIAFNNAFRKVFNIKQPCSISEEFVRHRIHNLESIRRVSVLSLLNRLIRSDNVILKTIFYQNFKYDREKCILASVWESLLFTHENKLIEYINSK